MGYDRYGRPDQSSRDTEYRDRDRSRTNDYRSDRDYGNSSGSGESRRYGVNSSRDDDRGGREYYGGARGGYGNDRSEYGADRNRSDYGDRNDRGGRGYGREENRFGRDEGSYGRGAPYRGSYASDGHRFTEHNDREQRRDTRSDERYDADDRGFLARAGDEVRSWFGDDEAERRRERDQRYDEQMARYDERSGDHAYRSWRDTQVGAFDRDYDEYRQENASKFQNEFAAFRTERQGQRDSLTRVSEHMEVLGSDGEHVGTVDKVRGDRIILTKNDVDAGGHHHSIPSRWVDSVDDKVKLRKTAAEAQQAWRDEDQGQAMFGNQQGNRQNQYGQDRFGQQDRTSQGSSTTTGQALNAGTSTTAGTGVSGTGDNSTNLNRSFPGTY